MMTTPWDSVVWKGSRRDVDAHLHPTALLLPQI